MFSAAGVGVGTAWTLERDIASGHDVRPAVAGLATGWAVVWRSPAIDAELGGIAYAMFDAATLRPTVRRANEAARGDQREPTVAAVDAGFVVAWTDASGLSSADPGLGIRARSFDAAGRATGGDIMVATTRAGDQSQPTLGGYASEWALGWVDASSGLPRVSLRRFTGTTPLDAADVAIGGGSNAHPAIIVGALGIGLAWTNRADDARGDIVLGWLPRGEREPATWTFGSAGDRDERPSVALWGGAEPVATYHTEASPRGGRVVTAPAIELPEDIAELRARLVGGGQDDVRLMAGSRALWVKWSERTSVGTRAAHAFALPWD